MTYELLPDDNPNHGEWCEVHPCSECLVLLELDEAERQGDYERDLRAEA